MQANIYLKPHQCIFAPDQFAMKYTNFEKVPWLKSKEASNSLDNTPTNIFLKAVCENWSLYIKDFVIYILTSTWFLHTNNISEDFSKFFFLSVQLTFVLWP